jgi:hypothetical protein
MSIDDEVSLGYIDLSQLLLTASRNSRNSSVKHYRTHAEHNP